MIDYSKTLIELRAKLDITQEELAKMFNVAFATINRWENKKSEPCKRHMQQLINLCNANKVKIKGV